MTAIGLDTHKDFFPGGLRGRCARGRRGRGDLRQRPGRSHQPRRVGASGGTRRGARVRGVVDLRSGRRADAGGRGLRRPRGPATPLPARTGAHPAGRQAIRATRWPSPGSRPGSPICHRSGGPTPRPNCGYCWRPAMISWPRRRGCATGSTPTSSCSSPGMGAGSPTSSPSAIWRPSGERSGRPPGGARRARSRATRSTCVGCTFGYTAP